MSQFTTNRIYGLNILKEKIHVVPTIKVQKRKHKNDDNALKATKQVVNEK